MFERHQMVFLVNSLEKWFLSIKRFFFFFVEVDEKPAELSFPSTKSVPLNALMPQLS